MGLGRRTHARLAGAFKSRGPCGSRPIAGCLSVSPPVGHFGFTQIALCVVLKVRKLFLSKCICRVLPPRQKLVSGFSLRFLVSGHSGL